MMIKKLLLLAMVLLPASSALADERPVGDWMLFKIMQQCKGDFRCFDDQVDHMAKQGVPWLISRAIRGERILPTNIQRIKQGRNYQKGLYYTTYEESVPVRRNSWKQCTMKVYYDPDSKRIKYLQRGQDCADDRLPDIPGLDVEPVQGLE